MKQKIRRTTLEEKQNILDQIREIVERIDNVQFAYAYGSFAEDMLFHDIDVGVYMSNIDKRPASQYALDLAGELGKTVNFPVDVRILNFAPVSFLYHVVRGIIIFERNEDLRAEIVERTVKRYLDIKPIIKKGIKEAFAA